MTKTLKSGVIITLLALLATAMVFCGLNSGVSDGSAYSASYNYSAVSFEINSQEDFESFYNSFSLSSDYTFANKKIYLNTDVDMAGKNGMFTSFFGKFYGNNHIINNASYAVFGTQTGSLTEIYNLVINNFSSVNERAAVTVSNGGVIDNVNVAGNMTGGVSGSAALAYLNANTGVIRNCTAAVNITSSAANVAGVAGLSVHNYGLIQNCRFLGDIAVKNTIQLLGGLVGYNYSYVKGANTLYAKVDRCFAAGIITITEDSADPESLTDAIGAIIGTNGGVAADCYFVGGHIGYGEYPTRAIGKSEETGAEKPYSNIYMMTLEKNSVYDLDLQTFVTADVSDINDSFDFSNGYYVSDSGAYPILRTFEGQGTESEPFLIGGVFDLYTLRGLYNTAGVDYYAVLKGDIECRNFDIAIEMPDYTYGVILDGRGFVLNNFGNESLLPSGRAENLGFYNSQADISGTLFDEGSNYDFGYDDEKETAEITEATPNIGAGTEENPYLIATAEELKYIDEKSGYFKLKGSIAVNTAVGLYNYLLKIDTFSGVLDGGGYTVTGLHEPLIATNGGTVKNLVLRGFTNESTGSIVCNVNNGTVENVKVNASFGENTLIYAPVAYINNGTVKLAKTGGYDGRLHAEAAGAVYINASAAIVENCYASLPSQYPFTAQNDGQVKTSVSLTDGVYTAMGQNAVAQGEYFALTAAGFDMENIFGYEINTSYPYPVLREIGVRYKKSGQWFDTRAFSYTYSQGVSYTKGQIVNQIVESAPLFTQAWKYNGAEYAGSTLSDAGIYSLKLTYGGSNIYLPAAYSVDITIKKAAAPASPLFGGGEFNNLSYTYQGQNIDISSPLPVNLSGYGYSFIHTVTKSGQAAQVKDAGAYVQTVKGVSNNYADVTSSRTITVSKASITVAVGNLEADYLAAVDLRDAQVTVVSGLVGADANSEIADLIEGSATFSSSFTAGGNAGEYYIDYSAVLTNYQIVQVNKGTLTVKAIDLPVEGIVFADKTATYTGYGITLLASADNGIDIAYDANTYTDAGEYTVKATFSKPNYNNLVLTARLTIGKAELNFIVKDLVLTYAEGRESIAQSTFSYLVQGLKGEDSLAQIAAELNFLYTVRKDGAEATDYRAGEYDIVLGILGELDNYDFDAADGTLTITPAAMTALYPVHTDYSGVYNGNAHSHPIAFFHGMGAAVEYEYSLGGTVVPEAVNAGAYTVNATVSRINENYLDTLYTYTLTVARAEIAIYFAEGSFDKVYSAENLATAESLGYSGSLPQGLTAQFYIRKGGVAVLEAKSAGTYTVGYSVGLSQNYNAKDISATLTIAQKEVAISIKSSYTYTASSILPEVTAVQGDYGNEVVAAGFSYTYYNSSGGTADRMSQSGNYTVKVSLISTDYYLSETHFAITINRLSVSVPLRYLEYSYGFTGNMEYGNISYTIYSGGIIDRKNFYIEEIGEYVILSYRISGDSASPDFYTVSAIDGGTNYVYTISADSLINNNNKVKILPVTISATWRYGQTDILESSKTVEYAGSDLTSYFSFKIWGLVNNQKQSDFAYEMKEIGAKSIYNAGSYTLRVKILYNSNYVMGDNTLTVNVIKKALRIAMNDATVMQGEEFTRYSYSITEADLIGADYANRAAYVQNIYALTGASLNVNKGGYTVNARAGDWFEYYFIGSFANYTLVIARVGKLTVTANTKIKFALSSVTYAYDGGYKSLRVAQSDAVIEANAVLVYSANNYQKNAGSYIVTLTVTYHADGSQDVLYATLTILPSYPVLSLAQIKTVYRENYTLPHSAVQGTATLNGNAVAGRFEFVEQYKLEKGSKAEGYGVVFFPADTDNLWPRTGVIYIESVEINRWSFEYSGEVTYITETGMDLEIIGASTMTLKPLLDGLALVKNGTNVTAIQLTRNESMLVEVSLAGETVFSQYMTVVYIDLSASVPEVVNESYLSLSEGLKFGKETIMVPAMGGRIALKDEYKSSMQLFINGEKITDSFVINGNEKTLIVVIKSIKTSSALYAEEFAVEPFTEKTVEKSDYTLWIVLASTVGGTLLLILIVVLIMKKAANRRMGFSPYSRK